MEEWYQAELTKLEQRWAEDLNRWISHIEKAIRPLTVDEGYIRALPFREDFPLNIEHSERVAELWDEYIMLVDGEAA